jgi:hypothetical protein
VARLIKQSPPDPARQLARLVRQLLWWHRLKTVDHVSFRCHFDNEAELLGRLSDEVLQLQTPSLFSAVPEGGSDETK